MPIYVYQHPNKEEFYEDLRSFKDADLPYISPDGSVCKRVLYPTNTWSKHSKGLVDKQCEVWDKDPSYVKKLKPKYVRTRDGQKIRYDPTKHC